MRHPQSDYSAYREASFGHAIFDIKNRTHAYYSWHQNDDGAVVKADSMRFFNRYHHCGAKNNHKATRGFSD